MIETGCDRGATTAASWEDKMNVRMISSLRMIAITMTLASIGLITLELEARANTGTPTPPWGENGWKMPVDLTPEASEEDWLRFGWDSFIAMNWPHKVGGLNGEPDKDSSIQENDWTDQSISPVWFTYNNKRQLFQKFALDPGDWNNPNFPKITRSYAGLDYPVFGASAMASTLDASIKDLFDEAFVDNPLLDQNGRLVLFEIYVNQSFWQYAHLSGYYDAQVQMSKFENGVSKPAPDNFVGFPETGAVDNPGLFGQPLPDYAQQGAMSVKVSWRQLTVDEYNSGRYFTKLVYYDNNQTEEPICTNQSDPGAPIPVGLVGMHILRLTPVTGHTWFWSSFEQVDNVTTDQPDGPSFNPGPDSTCSPPYVGGYTCVETCEDAGEGLQDDSCAPEPVTTESYEDGVCVAMTDNISNISRVSTTSLTPEIQAVNSEYQQALAGTPWQYYEQLNTLQPGDSECYVPPFNNNATTQCNTCDMTNTTMESYTQINFPSNYYDSGNGRIAPSTVGNAMNCINCHALAKPQGAAVYKINPQNEYDPVLPDDYPDDWDGLPVSNHYQVFTFLLNQAQNSCPSDLDLSGSTDIADLLHIMENWGVCDGYCPGDLDDNGAIGILDLLRVLDRWGDCDY